MKIDLLIICSDYYLMDKSEKISAQFHKVNPTVQYGKIEEIISYIVEHQAEIDVLLNYGFPAEELSNFTSLQIYQIELDPLELFRILVSMKPYQERTLVVGGTAFIKLANEIATLLDIYYRMIETRKVDHFLMEMSTAIFNDYQYFICSSSLNHVLQLYNIHRIPFTLSEENIKAKLNHIQQQMLPIKELKVLFELHKQFLTLSTIDYVITDPLTI